MAKIYVKHQGHLVDQLARLGILEEHIHCGRLLHLQPLASLQTLWQRLYVRDSLQNTLDVPGQTAKVKLRERNRDLKEDMAAVRKQLATLQTTARCWLEQQDQTDHDTVRHKTQTQT